VIVGEIEALRMQQSMCGYKPDDPNCAGVSEKLMTAYQKAINNPVAVNLLIGNAISAFEKLRSQTKGAVQVSQLADEQNAVLMRLIVLQNQRIIDLLERIATKK
jgi:hypothetical protein